MDHQCVPHGDTLSSKWLDTVLQLVYHIPILGFCKVRIVDSSPISAHAQPLLVSVFTAGNHSAPWW